MLLYLCVVSQIGSTALIWASSKGHLEVVKALDAAGADIQAKDEVGVARDKQITQWVMTCTRGIMKIGLPSTGRLDCPHLGQLQQPRGSGQGSASFRR